MEFRWVISQANVESYREFVEHHKNHSFVKTRISQNLKHIDITPITKNGFWQVLVGCLLTTQQKSGEGSRVDSFLKSSNRILDYNYCLKVKNISVIAKILKENGLRFDKKIAEQIKSAVNWLEQDGWLAVELKLNSIASYTSAKRERSVALYLQKQFKGIGPKQSRNLIQWMGLSKYEIPLDSRMVKVLRKLKFPVPLSAKALADEDYYCFIEDGIQMLAKKIEIYPCVFDACAFASFETNG
jgi:thermostable 8-oxoguanine DNA glycosylase